VSPLRSQSRGAGLHRRHLKSDSNVATALAPHIERGDVAILGESTAESFRKGLGAIRSLRRLFHSVQVPPTEPRKPRDILRAVVERGRA